MTHLASSKGTVNLTLLIRENLKIKAISHFSSPNDNLAEGYIVCETFFSDVHGPFKITNDKDVANIREINEALGNPGSTIDHFNGGYLCFDKLVLRTPLQRGFGNLPAVTYNNIFRVEIDL